MTADKDFKRLVRERARATGESYMTARRRLLALPTPSGRGDHATAVEEEGSPVRIERAVPVVRVFDADLARAFYVDYLGCRPDWEHRFEPELPRYVQVSRDELVLHLSEHHGDGTPGTTIYVEVTGVAALHEELLRRDDTRLRPGLEQDEIGTHFEVIDPFGNTLRFNERPRT